MRKPVYSGSECSGMCVCGCPWNYHHLCIVMNADYVKETGEAYIPDECTNYGFNEVGGMKYNNATDEWEDHCFGYKDTGVQEKI